MANYMDNFLEHPELMGLFADVFDNLSSVHETIVPHSKEQSFRPYLMPLKGWFYDCAGGACDVATDEVLDDTGHAETVMRALNDAACQNADSATYIGELVEGMAHDIEGMSRDVSADFCDGFAALAQDACQSSIRLRICALHLLVVSGRNGEHVTRDDIKELLGLMRAYDCAYAALANAYERFRTDTLCALGDVVESRSRLD